MYRISGAIPTLRRDKYPSRLVVFDTEAYRGVKIDGLEVQTLRLGVGCYMELDESLDLLHSNFYNFRDGLNLTEWLEYLTRKDKSLYVYAHNLKYDLQLSGLLTLLIERGWSASLFVLEDPPTFIRLKKGRKSLMFVDTFNYWQFSLSKMGEQLGLPKMSMPEDNAPDSKWYAYCKRDVEVLSEYLLSFMRFLHSEGLCGLGLTVASQAFRSYRYKFMSREIEIHNKEKVLSLEREGYSGGRVEALFIGSKNGEDFYKLDVNSMYPYVMKTFEYPYKFVSYAENMPLSRLEKLLVKYYVIAETAVQTPLPVYPVKSEHKLIFPVGRFETVLHQTELEYALRCDHIREIKRLAIYEGGDLFSTYVNYFYGHKLQAEKEDNPVMRQQAKLFLNSLYGKFGQLGIESKILDNPGQFEYKRLTGYSETLGCKVEVNYLGDKIELRYQKGESAYSFPAIAGAVTANARMILWGLIERAGIENVFYYDTDSLIVNQAGFINVSHLIDESLLGTLKLEGVERNLSISGLKDYVFGSKKRTKGVPSKAIELSEGLWSYEQFRGAKTWLVQGLPANVEVYTRQKRRLSLYNKGVIQLDGRILPLELG